MQRRPLLVLLALVLLPVAARSARQEAPEFPRNLVAWAPLAAEPVFRGEGGDAWDRKIRERGWIRFEGGEYHLWYTGYNDDRSPSRFLGYATSPDGISWTRHPSNPLTTEGWVEDMCVVEDGGTYYMFAEGLNDVAHLLTSTDKVRWTERGPLDIRNADGRPITPGPRGTPAVYVEDGRWHLFYESGDRGVWLARSDDPDRIRWTNVRDEPVIAMGPDVYDSTAVALNQVVKQDGWYYGFYHANEHQPWRDWTSNVARSRDLVTWEKYPGNPIVGDNCSSPILVDGPDGTRLYTMHPEVRAWKPAAPSK